MDNMYRPSGGTDPQDARSTEQFWAPPPAPSGPGPQGPQPPSSLQQHDARDRRHALRWSIGLTLAVALAAGGVLAGVALAGHGAPASSASPAGDTSAAGQPGGQAAALNTALNAAGAPGALTLTSAAGTATGGTGTATTGVTGTGTAATGGSTTVTAAHPCLKARAAARAARLAGRSALARAARAAAAHCRWIRRRLVRVFLLRGIDGQFTFRTRQGTIRTLAFERGVIQSVSGSDIVVRAADGTTWSWDLVSSTVVREHGAKTSTSALASGEPVWVGGPVVSGAKDARLVVIRPPSAPTSSAPTSSAPSTATPAPSASGS
jgi:hypothetical protein